MHQTSEHHRARQWSRHIRLRRTFHIYSTVLVGSFTYTTRYSQTQSEAALAREPSLFRLLTSDIGLLRRVDRSRIVVSRVRFGLRTRSATRDGRRMPLSLTLACAAERGAALPLINDVRCGLSGPRYLLSRVRHGDRPLLYI